MTGTIDLQRAREALASLPEGTSHGEPPAPEHVYVPSPHLKAMDPDTMLVTGMRGAGKTFWWSALQQADVRRLLRRYANQSALGENTEVRTGFGVRPDLDHYPGKDVLRDLVQRTGVEPRIIWRTVQAWHLAPHDHPFRQRDDWIERTGYVDDNPEMIDRLFAMRDVEFDRKGVFFLILFDALDRCSDDWRVMYRLIRGLMQTAIDMRSYRRIRVKVFLRSDQNDETEIGDFPDASKVIASAVELSWPARELYGLLWHHSANGANGEIFRKFLSNDDWPPIQVGQRCLYPVPRPLILEGDYQREKFHRIAGPWMGTNRRRGLPYTWIPKHLADAEERVSPRSFLTALRKAAENTRTEHPDHRHALHYDAIKFGVQAASKTRVQELQEDYPWVPRVLEPLADMGVPCEFEDVVHRWDTEGVLDRLAAEAQRHQVKLPPRHMEQGPDGVREDLEALGVFQRLHDGRVNIPDIFRVSYGLRRKGGVKPVR